MTGDSRSAIRAAAGLLFAQRSFAQTTIREIAELAHVSPGLVIKHFRSKGELYLEVGPRTERISALDLPREVLGRALVSQIFDRHERGASEPWIDHLVAIRNSPEPHATRVAARKRIVANVATLIGDTSPDFAHARAVITQAIGIAHATRELGLFDGEDSDRDRAIVTLSLSMQASIDACVELDTGTDL